MSDESSNVIELSRLWVHDSIKKNMASYLIGNTLKLLDNKLGLGGIIPKDAGIVVSLINELI